VQWVLGHAHITTTEIYLAQGSGIASDERVAGVLARRLGSISRPRSRRVAA